MINRVHLADLFGGDEAMVERFIGIFKMQTPQQISELKAAVDEENWPQVAILAHTIKSQCAYLGLDSITNTAHLIEQQAEQQNFTPIPKIFKQLEQDLSPILKSL